MEFGEKLKAARTRSGLTQEEVARKLGVSRQSLSNWENNRTYPDLASALKLSDLYGLSLDDMLKDDMELRRQMERRQETIRKVCYWGQDLGLLFFPIAIVLMRFDQYGLSVALGAMGLVIYGVSQCALSGKLGMPWKWAGLKTLSVILWLAGALWRFYDPGNGYGMLMLIGGLCLQSYVNYKIEVDPRYIKRNSMFTGFVIAVVLLCAAIPPISDSMERGDFNEYDPFTNQDYRVAEVLAGEEETPLRVHLTSNYTYLEYPGEEAVPLGGEFTYVTQPEGAKEKGVWEMIPEESPNLRYRVVVEADEDVVIFCAENGQTRWAYRIEPSPMVGCTMLDVLGVTTWSADWYRAGTFVDDGEYARGCPSLRGKGSLRISVPGDSRTVTIYEEHHHGDRVQTRTMELEKDRRGFVEWKIEPEHDGQPQYAIYRIPYEDGEFVVAIRFTA